MSLIESAVRRAKAAGQTESETSLGRRPAVRRPPPSEAEVAEARRFQPAQLDTEVMERSGVLQQVSDEAAMRAFKILRTRVLQRLEAQNWQSFAVTAAGAVEGKTLTAINLAISLAQAVNTWVFLVDLDLRRPKMAQYLGMTFSYGMDHYLSGQAELNQIIYETGIPRLAVIPTAQRLSNSSELLVSPRMGDFQHALAAESPRRLIIYDMPPVLMSDDVLAFSPYVDSLLLVVAEAGTRRSALEESREALAERNLLGVVLNRSTERNDADYY
jgi:protein-tyrosine kinase